jgi:hypothetical protein
MEEGLAARVHDALWLLARQWQLGEFHGKDAGTPALVTVAGDTTPINAWRGASKADWTPFDPHQNPLDELVEPEGESAPDLRERIEAGVHFQRLLAAAGLQRYAAAFLAAHPLDPQAQADAAFAADPLLAAVARRTPDGLVLHATAVALTAGGPVSVAIDAADKAAASAVAAEWLAWYADEIAEAPASGATATWQDHRLEYGLAVSSPAAGGVVLTAEAYWGDGLDWFDFDIDTKAPAQVGAVSTPVSARAVPSPVRYGGMPLPRFWAMEDARYDFGSVDAAANDVGRLLLVEFATVYGNDWHILPLKLPSGSLTILTEVVVSDVFGRNLVLDRAGKDDPQWNLFSLSTQRPPPPARSPAQDALFLPPTVGYAMESAPVETVRFLRDEMADLAWAVEAVVEDALERRIDRRAIWIGHRPAPPPGDPAMPSYRVETIVPDHWVPLAPEQLPGAPLHLRLTPMEADDGGVPRTVEPRGRLLGAGGPDQRLWIFEEEIPREGALVDRLRRYARWQGGHSRLWTARRRGVGTGEGSSGLKFDVLDPY